MSCDGVVRAEVDLRLSCTYNPLIPVPFSVGFLHLVCHRPRVYLILITDKVVVLTLCTEERQNLSHVSSENDSILVTKPERIV